MIDDATTAALASAAAWAVIGIVTGFLMHRTPVARLDHDGPLTRSARWETRRFYRDRLRIHRWKDRLPEAGAFFRGGFAKRHIADHSPAHLRRWAAETRRAEYTHWLNIAAGPLFVLWCPPWLALVMVLFALVAHLPFVAVQRYNRLRLLASLERSGDQSVLKV